MADKFTVRIVIGFLINNFINRCGVKWRNNFLFNKTKKASGCCSNIISCIVRITKIFSEKFFMQFMKSWHFQFTTDAACKLAKIDRDNSRIDLLSFQ